MKFVKKLVLPLIIGISILIPVLAVTASAASGEVTTVSKIYDGSARDVYVDGSHAYVSTGYGGLKIYDISSLTNPVKIGEITDIGYVESVAVVGDYAYVAAGEDGFISLDISDLTAPEILDSYLDSGDQEHATEIVVNGNFAYLADGGDGFEIFDISQPDNLYRRSEVDGTNLYFDSAEIVGTDLYVVGENGMRVYDVSNEYFPASQGSFQDGGINIDVEISGDFAFLADLTEGLEIVNISDYSNITEVGQYDAYFESLMSVTIDGNYAYAMSKDGFEIIDVTDVTNPVRIGGINNGYGRGIDINGNYAFVCEYERGVGIYDISNKANPTEYSRIDEFMIVEEITIGNHIYAAIGEEGILQIDGSTPNSLSIAAEYSSSPIYKVEAHEGYLYGVSDGDLKIISETSMTEVASYVGDFIDVTVFGTQAFVFYYEGFSVLNISTPSSPVFLGNYTHDGVGLETGLVDGTIMYAVDPDEGIHFIDISDPTNPTVINDIAINFVDKIVKQGDYLYTVARNLGFSIIDVSNIDSPTIISNYRSVLKAPLRGLVVKDDVAMIGVANGILFMDISDPTEPTIIDEHQDEQVIEIQKFGNYVVYTTGNGGIKLIEVSITLDKKIPGFSTLIIIGTIIGVSGLFVLRKYKK